MNIAEWRNDTYVPYENRKKVLLLSDDLRLPSGVGTVSRHIVENTLHHFNWVQVGAAINHPEAGKVVDMAPEYNKLTGLDNTYMKIFPCSGYGNPDLIRFLLNTEKPDVVLHFTDPRQWIWLYQMENELRQHAPLLFYHIWDDLPFPQYNEVYYESCDWIASISKQTYNIVKQVMQRNPLKDWQTKYIPHGIDSSIFKPISFTNPGKSIEYKDSANNISHKSEFEELLEFKKKLFAGKEFEYVIMYNNRNIRRKMTGDVILAYKTFCEQIGADKAKKTVLLMHTTVIDDNGTDLKAVASSIAPECNIVFSTQKLEQRFLNYMYNISDVFINIASNEGFGLTTAESLMAGTPIIGNVTGGLQDQMGFVDEDGKYLCPDTHYNETWSSNHDRKYATHGEWVFPIWPKTRSMVGSPPTPYIFDDRVSWEDAANMLEHVYNMDSEERNRRGLLGREYLCDPAVGMEVKQMGLSFIDGINDVIDNWKPTRGIHTIKVDNQLERKYPTGITRTVGETK